MEWEREEEERKRSRKEELMRRDVERRMNPRCKEDFDLVYAALESLINFFLTLIILQ